MRRSPKNRAAGPVRTRRTAGVPARSSSAPTGEMAPVVVLSTSSEPALPLFVSDHTGFHARRTLFALIGPGLILWFLYLACYPLLAASFTNGDPVLRSWNDVFPLLPLLRWLAALFAQVLARVAWLSPASAGGNANLLLLLLALALLVVLLASLVGRRATRVELAPRDAAALFRTIFSFTVLFSITMFCSPTGAGVFSRDMLLSGLYGRMVVIYHVNPYTVAPANFPHDIMQVLLASIPGNGAKLPIPTSGPVWIDISILVSLVAHDTIAGMVIGFRLIGVLAHLGNALLIWSILAKLKPETRVAATLLYAWNPLVLLLAISQVHQEVVLIFFVLLAIHFLGRDGLLLAWFFVLLAALVNLSCLLLLPLFLRLLLHRTRFMRWGWYTLWWLGLITLSLLVIVLAYIPYWQDGGGSGLLSALVQTFWQDSALNSLNAAILTLPFRSVTALSWLLSPSHWSVFMLLVLALFMLFALWLVDTLEYLLFCCCWMLLLFVALQPIYWPWYVLPPLALALCCAHRKIIMLAILLLCGALAGYYYWLWHPAWQGQGLVTIGIPFLLWGWLLFFTSTWRMTRPEEADEAVNQPPRRPRPPWLSRPSWPSRPGRSNRGR